MKVTCSACKGTGDAPLSDNMNWLTCPKCGGTGQVEIPERLAMSGPDLLDRDLAGDLLGLAEALRRRRALLTDDAPHADVANDLPEAIRLIEQAAGRLESTE
jgi:hypothetical protein